jgi:hypothetical protein
MVKSYIKSHLEVLKGDLKHQQFGFGLIMCPPTQKHRGTHQKWDNLNHQQLAFGLFCLALAQEWIQKDLANFFRAKFSALIRHPTNFRVEFPVFFLGPVVACFQGLCLGGFQVLKRSICRWHASDIFQHETGLPGEWHFDGWICMDLQVPSLGII